MNRKPEQINPWQIKALNAVYRACAIEPSGWADSRQIVQLAYGRDMSRRFGGSLIAPTLTVLRGWKKPLVEARDSGYGTKEYRLTAAGKRARKDARSSAVPD